MPFGSTTSDASFGPYEIRAPLGRGGMGEVYRAWDSRLHREVALKILSPRSEMDPDRMRRFVAEARAASALNHPNILAVFDAVVDGDTPYIVSELIEGESLRVEIQRGPMPVKRLLDLATQIADGLSDAHAAGIVHRDLKPENIMVTRTGRAKILDFGLTRPTGFRTGVTAARSGRDGVEASVAVSTALGGQTATEPGLLAGTVPYMSPEQARGSATDLRSDQFSFGLILYEMATGTQAFRRETPAETLDAIANDEPTALPQINPQTPLLLWWIIERCLAKNPGDRYGMTSDLHRDLRMLRDRLGDAIGRERGSTHAGQAPRFISRLVLPVAALLALAVAAGLVWSVLATPQAPDLTQVLFTPLATESGYDVHPALSPKGQTVAYAAEVGGILQIFTRRLSSSESAQVTQAPYDCKHPFWSPDGQRLYYVSLARDRDGIWSVGAAGGTPQVVVENATRGAMSRDGRTLAFLRDEQRADIVGTSELWLSTPNGAAPWSSEAVEAAARKQDTFGGRRFIEGALSFSPDGNSLGMCVVPEGQKELGWQFWIVPLPDGRPYRRFEWWSDAAPRVSNFTWLPDSRHIVIGITSLATPGSHLWVADLQRDRAWPLTRSADSESYPSSSPSGEQIVFTKGEPDYDLVQMSLDGTRTHSLLATARNESDAEWSADGDLLAYVTDRSGQDEIWLRTRQGQQGDRPLITQRQFGEDRTLMLSAPSFSPDRQRIAYLRNGYNPRWFLRIWISLTADGQPTALLPRTYEAIQGAPTWSPDGEWIAFAEWKDGHWELVKVRVGSGEGPVVLRTNGVPNATPHWSPKNDWITWETEQGFVLVSPDGKAERVIPADQWLVHTWSRDGSQVLGITETDDLRLSLVAVDVRTERTKVLADLGPSLPANNQVKGLSLSGDGRITTSIVRLRGDLYMLDGLRWKDDFRRRLWAR
jgi:eukaryotic-like serine/threonine-protein kinase